MHLSSLNGSCPVVNAILCIAAQLLQKIARGLEHPSYVIIGDTCRRHHHLKTPQASMQAKGTKLMESAFIDSCEPDNRFSAGLGSSELCLEHNDGL